MAVGVAPQRGYITGYVAISAISLICALARFYVLRHRCRTLSFFISDVLFGLAIVIMVGVRVYDLILMVRELRILENSDLELFAMFKTFTVTWMKYTLAELFLHLIMVWLVKGAFVAMYWNLVPNDGHGFSRRLRWALYTTAFVLVATFVCISVVWLTFCPHLSDNWDLKALLRLQFCSPHWGLMPQTVWLGLSLLTDLMIFIIALTIVSRLKTTKLERRILPVVFGMGLIPFIAPIVRYATMLHDGNLSSSKAGVNNAEGQLTLAKFHLVVILTYLETMGAILAFSMPAFRFLLSGAKSRPLRPDAIVSDRPSRRSKKKSRKTPTDLAMGSTYADDTELTAYTGTTTLVGEEHGGYEDWSAIEPVRSRSEHSTTMI